MREIYPDDLCDRCGHASKWHAVPTAERIASDCRIVVQFSGSARARKCTCDGFVPKP